MIATVYQLPSWISNIDNKPTLQAFHTILTNAKTETLSAQTTITPDLLNVVVQSSYEIGEWYKYNYILIDGLWYVIDNVTYNSDNNEVVDIHGNLDIYLSFVLPYFDETANVEVPVFFSQKHMNRYYYMNNSTVINFSQQFYLKSKHKQLGELGSCRQKTVDVSWTLNYNNQFSGDGYSNVTLTNAETATYIYAILKMSANETNQAQYNQFSSYGLMNVADSWSIQTINNTNYINAMIWWYTLRMPKAAYLDFIVLPMDVSQSMINNNSQYELITNTGLITDTGNYCPGTVGTNDNALDSLGDNNFLVYNVGPQNLYYFYTGLNAAINFGNIETIYNLDPYLIQYCSFRVRGAGEDSVIDMTSFDNFTAISFINSVYSFCIDFNHPVTQITNISYAMLLQYDNDVNNWLQPYMYNKVSDVWYVLNWKSVYPSNSNNWSNYLAEHLNQYQMGKNITHYKLQEAQADVGFNTARVATATIGGAIGGFFDGGIAGAISGAANAAVNAGEDLTNSIFNEMSQSQEYNYYVHGMKGDMTRTSNERLSVENNIIAYNNSNLCFIFEWPVNYELYLVVNYCALNGYIVKRWIPWKYWLNRKYCNYVQCAYFSDAMIPTMNQKYKFLIDKLFNHGFRVWTSNNGYMETVPFSSCLISGLSDNYGNVELNENNDELMYIVGNINE